MSTSKILIADIQKQSDNVQWIPAEIQHDGVTNVHNYFESTVRRDESENMTASLRGRPLIGSVMDIPSGYTGLILKESRRPFNEDEERELKAAEAFQSFRYWDLDRAPSAEDKFHQALLWLDVAKALHLPVDEQDSQSSLSSQKSLVDH